MATGLTAFAVGALLAVGSSIFLILAALGLAVFVGGMAIELRERLVNRANR